MTLRDLPLDTPALVTQVRDPSGSDIISQRLRELGFVPGEPVEVVGRGPLGGEPLLIRIGFTRFALRGENGTVVAHDTMEIAPTTGAGTRVTYTAEFEFKGLAKLVVPFIGGAMKKLGDEAEQGLRDALAKL